MVCVISLFIPDPKFQGQTKDKLSNTSAQKFIENIIKDRFENWLSNSPQQAEKLLEWIISFTEDRLRRKKEKETSRKTAIRKIRLRGNSLIARRHQKKELNYLLLKEIALEGQQNKLGIEIFKQYFL
ncbi:MAG: hypothetical protein CM15mP29_2640 [Alphaproteobacteria bacterium]|nr:MAG: hypothetical protein CM15mP29_2640 [Alphaproteobacteria bacterium]